MWTCTKKKGNVRFYSVKIRGFCVKPSLQWKNNKYYVFRVCLSLVIQHVMRLGPIDICGLSGCTIFFHIVT